MVNLRVPTCHSSTTRVTTPAGKEIAVGVSAVGDMPVLSDVLTVQQSRRGAGTALCLRHDRNVGEIAQIVGCTSCGGTSGHRHHRSEILLMESIPYQLGAMNRTPYVHTRCSTPEK